MSWRHPESPSPKTKTNNTASTGSANRFCAKGLMRNLRDLERMKVFKKTPGLVEPEMRVYGLNAQEETIAAGANKIGRIKYRMVGLGQAIERNHAKHRRQCGSQDGALKGHRNKRRPRMKRLPTDVEGIVHCRNPVLKGIPSNHSQHGPAQRDQGHAIMVDSNGLGCFFQRIRSIRIHLAVAVFVSCLRCMDQVRVRIELSH